MMRRHLRDNGDCVTSDTHTHRECPKLCSAPQHSQLPLLGAMEGRGNGPRGRRRGAERGPGAGGAHGAAGDARPAPSRRRGAALVAGVAPSHPRLPHRRGLPAALPQDHQVQRAPGAGHAGALPDGPSALPALVPRPRRRRPAARGDPGRRLRAASAPEGRLWAQGHPVVRRTLRPVQVHGDADGALPQPRGGGAHGRRREPGARLHVRQRRVGAAHGPREPLVAQRHPPDAALHPEVDAHAPQGHALPQRPALRLQGVRVLPRAAQREAAVPHQAALEPGGPAPEREPADPAPGVRRRGSSGDHDRGLQGRAAQEEGRHQGPGRHDHRRGRRDAGPGGRLGRKLPQAGGGLRL